MRPRWGFESVCLECAYIAFVLLVVSTVGQAAPMGLNQTFIELWADSLFMVVVISILGGMAGIFARLQDQRWQLPVGGSKGVLWLLAELSGSVFSGVLLFFLAAYYELTAYITIATILIGAWVGTKATRLVISVALDRWTKFVGKSGGNNHE